MAKTRVMVTGLGGSIGVHMFAHIMNKTDWDVVGVDSFRHKGIYARIAQACKDKPEWFDRLTIITHDLMAPFSSSELKEIGKIDHIINLASLCDVWDSVEDPVPFVRNNVELTIVLLEFARQIKPKSFVQFSTDEVYGPADVDKGWSEWDPMVPSNPYSASKAMQEMLGISYWRSYGVPLIITNTMNNFAEYQGVSKYPVIIQQKLMADEPIDIHVSSDGQIGTRYYIHSRNVADAVLYILENAPAYLHQAGKVDRPDRYNIVGDAQVDNLKMAQTIAKLMGKELKYNLVDFHSKEPGHDLHYGLSGKKLDDLGWKSPISFEDSLKSTIDWQMEHPEWLR